MPGGGEIQSDWLIAGFVDELVKMAKKTDLQPTWRQRLLPYAGALGGAGAAAAGLVGVRPALRAHLVGMFGGGARAKPLAQGVQDLSKQVAAHLRSKGFDPSKARIGISATGGTGKSTLARGLATELGMTAQHLDDSGKSFFGRNLPKFMKKHPLQPGSIAEQTHLLNQMDPDAFDAIIHLEKPMDVIKKQLMGRGRGAGQLEVYDYDKLHKAVRTGFDMTEGEAFEIAPGVRIKLKGQGGFQSNQMLENRLRGQGIDPMGLNRQQRVISASTGKRTSSPGVVPYLRGGRITAGAGILGAGGVAGGVGANQFASSDR